MGRFGTMLAVGALLLTPTARAALAAAVACGEEGEECRGTPNDGHRKRASGKGKYRR